MTQLENGWTELARKLEEVTSELDKYRRLDSEAAQYVESVIAMRTGFTGEGKYVGWKGLGIALTEALDERDKLKAEREQMEKQEPCGYQQFINGEATQNYARDSRDKEMMLEMALLLNPANRVEFVKFYAHPPVPDGKVLVPVEPTAVMLAAGWEATSTHASIPMVVYKAMLQAAQNGE